MEYDLGSESIIKDYGAVNGNQFVIGSRKYDLVVCLQPDHPDREHTFDYCVDYMVENNYDDLITMSYISR